MAALTAHDARDWLSAWVSEAAYPCLGARAVFGRDRAHVMVTGEIGMPRSSRAVAQVLRGFGESVDVDGPLTSCVAVFDGPRPRSEVAFEQALWRTLHEVHALDEAPWNAEVSADPGRADFSFSFGGVAYFVVGLHPLASRPARRTPWPVLVFNLHAQFEQLRGSGRFERMRDVIRARDAAAHGSINPMVDDYGSSSEARQYSGRAVESDWVPPVRWKWW